MRFEQGTYITTDYHINLSITVGACYEVLEFDDTICGKELVLIENDNGQDAFKFYESNY